MPASVKDVAALAGVSTSTVSNYLNHPEVLSDRSRTRVRDAIAQLGYLPNESARQLRAGEGKTIGLILLDAWLPYFSELSRGVEDVTRAGGWSLFFSNSARDAQQEQRNIDLFAAHQARGIIIYPLGNVTARLDGLAARGIRSVVVGMPHDSASVGFVPFDDLGGGRLAGEHLAAIGRRRIAFLGNVTVSQSADRLAGVREATAGRAEVRPIPTRGFAIGDGIASAEQIIALPPASRPDAIFAVNDMLAIGAMTALIRAGLTVPGDIAVVGFDDVQQAQHAIVPLTSIRQPGYDIGRAAATSLLHLVENPADPAPPIRPFSATLIPRASTVG